MVDVLTTIRRSALMGRIRSKDSTPEMTVRRLAHGAGYRYRLHRRDLPGTPDLVFSSRRKAIFVHGCFWHQHRCAKAKRPSTNVEFWNTKLDGNVVRDRTNIKKLREMGWRVLIVWECEIDDAEVLLSVLADFLGDR